ncbi:MAG: NAD(P)/FAD-dependent oxidoreductase [Akkermansiaceae bacterium]
MQNSPEKVIVVGGGIIGLCSAYYAAKRGLDVTVLDRDPESDKGCSFGNAGMVVPSHFIPLAAPGMIAKGMRWMMNPESPFYVKPRLSWDLAKWGLQFWKHANEEHTETVKHLLADLSLESRKLFTDLAEEEDFCLQKRGLLMLCKTQKGLDAEASVAAMANELSVSAEVCDSKRISQLDPTIEMNVTGGVWFEQDCHLDPTKLMAVLRHWVKKLGGQIRYESEVTDFVTKDGKLTGVKLSNGEPIHASQIVMACGAWTPTMTQKLGKKLCMQAGKGYSLTLQDPAQLPELCSIFSEAKVAVTPIGNTLRFAGTMEIGGNNLDINPRRVQGIIKSVKDYFPQFSDTDFTDVKPWAGLRPCTPDGLPYIGKMPDHDNVIVATGHAMMGLSLGPITGQLVARMLDRSGTPDKKLAVRF